MQKRLYRIGSVLFFVFWLIVLGFSYWYFLVKPKQWFDPEMVQPPLLSEPQNQASLRAILQTGFPKLRNDRKWFVRFLQPDCGCERFVELYHQSFSNRAPQDMQVATVDFSSTIFTDAQLKQISAWVPATPAVVVFDLDGSIRYLGPYHQEGICSAENSYLEPVLESMVKGKPLSVLNTLVFGCFCSTGE